MEDHAAEARRLELWPPWLYPLLGASFFGPCKSHHGISARNECNMYCLDCAGGAICSSCIAGGHRDHRVIQIRRSSYHDVIRVTEIQKHLDISGVQTYIINGARIVFLNERPQLRGGKPAANICINCRRGLLDAFAFCSLGCKLAKTATAAGIPTGHWNPAITQEPKRARGSSGGSSTTMTGMKPLKRKSNFGYEDELGIDSISPPTPPIVGNNRVAKRRKGIPHRAPMGVC